MNCKICFMAYDHSKHKPLSLSCPHTFCQHCINQLVSNNCPNCNEPIRAKYPNLALLELIPESKYDQLKKKLEKAIISSNEQQQKFLIDANRIYTDNFQKLNTIKQEIDQQTNDLINSIKQNQLKLLLEVEEFKRKLSEIHNNFTSQIPFEEANKEVKQAVESNDLNETQMSERIRRVESTSQRIAKLYDNLTNDLNENFQLVINKQIDLDNLEFAELKSNNKTIKELVSKGLELYYGKKYTEAIESADQVLVIKPTCATAINLKGLALKELKKNKQASECFTQAIEIEPTNHIYYLNKGCALLTLKDYSKAMVCFNKSLELKPNFDLAFNSKGVILNDMKKYNEAIECFNKAIELDSKNPTFYFNLAETFKNKKEFKLSLDLVNKAIEMKPDYGLAFNLKGLMLLELKDFKNSVVMFNKACEIDPQNSSFTTNRTNAIKHYEAVEPSIKKRKFH